MQYSVKAEDLKATAYSTKFRGNVFSVSDRDTSNTTENNSKYLGTTINFNNIDKKENRRKVLESFNLVTINKKPQKNKTGLRTLNLPYKESPRSTNRTTIEHRINDKFSLNIKRKPDFIFAKNGKFMREINFKNLK